MTDMRKICPKSGEKCDCPKGQCLLAVNELLTSMNSCDQEMLTTPKLYHEQRHEHDAEQLAFYQKAAEHLCEDEGCPQFGMPHVCITRFECPTCESKGFEPSKLPNRCTFCDGTFSGNPPTAEEIYEAQTPEVQSHIDRQEAGSLKYALCAQILLLSSGKFALFGAYSMQEGLPLLVIDTWAALEPHVRAYRKAAEEGYAREKQGEEQRRNTRAVWATADYDSLFGEEG